MPFSRTFPRWLSRLEWLAVALLAAALTLSVVSHVRAAPREPPPDAPAATLTSLLGAGTGVLAVINPGTCSISANAAAALNSAARIPGMRVTVVALALPPGDSTGAALRRDFDLDSSIVIRLGARVDPRTLPPLLRQPFVALVRGGQLQHIAFGGTFSALSRWLPGIIGGPRPATTL